MTKFEVELNNTQQIDLALTAFIITGIFMLTLIVLQQTDSLGILDPIRNYWKDLLFKIVR